MVKILLLPVVVLGFFFGVVLSLFRFIFSLLSGICRFSFGRIFGGIFGACVGMLGGKKHVRVKWFPRKK